MLIVRCKNCNREIVSNTKTQVCGCPNMMTVREDSVTAVDLSKVCLLYTSPSPRDAHESRMPSSA